MNAERIVGNVLHKSIPANQPSQHLLRRHTWRSTEEVILWVAANSASLHAPVSEVSDNLRRSWPSFLWNVNEINVHENKQIFLSTDPNSCTTVLCPWGKPYVPWSQMVSSYSQLIFLFRAGWWQWHARHLNHIFSSGKDQCFLGEKMRLKWCLPALQKLSSRPGCFSHPTCSIKPSPWNSVFHWASWC